jgi:hypothetical protein
LALVSSRLPHLHYCNCKLLFLLEHRPAAVSTWRPCCSRCLLHRNMLHRRRVRRKSAPRSQPQHNERSAADQQIAIKCLRLEPSNTDLFYNELF